MTIYKCNNCGKELISGDILINKEYKMICPRCEKPVKLSDIQSQPTGLYIDHNSLNEPYINQTDKFIEFTRPSGRKFALLKSTIVCFNTRVIEDTITIITTDCKEYITSDKFEDIMEKLNG